MAIKEEDDGELLEDTLESQPESKPSEICDSEDDYEEGYEDDYEDKYDDEDYDDSNDNGRKVKIIVASIIVAAIIAVIGIVMYNKIKSDNKQNEVRTETKADISSEPMSDSEKISKNDTSETGDNINGQIPDENVSESDSSPSDVNTEMVDEAASSEDVSTNTEGDEGTNLLVPTSTPKPLPTESPIVEENTDAEVNNNSGNTSDLISDTGITEPADVIFIGDTRFRNMANIADSNADLWECSSSGNYEWLTNTAYPDVEPRVGEGTEVFINIGINDLTRYQSYAISINDKAAEWKEKGANVYFVAIGPVAQASTTSNQEITEFNTYMYNNLDIPFIDAYNYLIETGFSTNDVSDGVEYTDETSVVLYDYLNGLIGR